VTVRIIATRSVGAASVITSALSAPLCACRLRALAHLAHLHATRNLFRFCLARGLRTAFCTRIFNAA